MSDIERRNDDPQPAPHALEVGGELARITATAWLRGASWGVSTTLRAARRLRTAVAGDEAAAAQTPETREAARVRSLRERGAELFERAARLEKGGEPVHPGFDRIIDQLAPDEARVLRLLVNAGPQAIVYVNRSAPLGIGAREVARRLSLIGPEAGCLHPDHVPAYLDNLVRLGLVAIRRDPVPDESAYQVVEAQPEVVEAMRSVGGAVFRARSARRSVHLTDFGRTFCQVCFPPEHLSAALEPIDLEEGVEPPAPGAEADPA